MAVPRRLKIGELLLQEGLLTPAQLEHAIAVQKGHKGYAPLGEICVELNLLPRADLERILKTYQNRIRLGELLTHLGLVTEEQVEQALVEQRRSHRKRLGAILIEQGFVTEAALMNVLSIQLGIPKIVPHYDLIDKTLLKGISLPFLQKHEALPAFKQGDVLTVIVSDPLNDALLQDLEKAFGCQIQLALASAEDIRSALRLSLQVASSRLASRSDAQRKDLIIGQTNVSREADPVVEILNFLISHAILDGASDIHIEPQETRLRVRYRVDGVLQHKTDLPIYLAANLTSRIKVLCGLDIAERRRHQDGRIEARVMGKEVDLRISTYAAVHGENVVIRVLHRQTTLTKIESLGFSPANRERYLEVLGHPSGVILVTGPTGSGKTTTLYASLSHVNNLERKIITVEDPVEYTLDGVVQGKLDPKLELTYSDFLQSMMRQDPDVIMVGEIRNHEAAAAVIQAALTGHKVFSTFHTNDTVGALLRLMDMGIETFLISSTVVCVVSQRLVRVLCAACRQPAEPDADLLAAFHLRAEGLKDLTLYRPAGCSECGGTGFKGRSGIHELLLVNDAIREAIRARQPASDIRRIGRDAAGLISMHEDGFYKAAMGVTSLEEVLRVVFSRESDSLPLQLAKDVIARCEGRAAGMPAATALPPATPKIPLAEMPPPTLRDRTSWLSGERYRVRFDVERIEAETERVAELFQAYRTALAALDQALDASLLEDFVDFVVDTVRRLEATGAEDVEFCVRVDGERVGIFVETWLPDMPGPSQPSRETGLRRVNFLK